MLIINTLKRLIHMHNPISHVPCIRYWVYRFIFSLSTAIMPFAVKWFAFTYHCEQKWPNTIRLKIACRNHIFHFNAWNVFQIFEHWMSYGSVFSASLLFFGFVSVIVFAKYVLFPCFLEISEIRNMLTMNLTWE
jgi:hypothetical protein